MVSMRAHTRHMSLLQRVHARVRGLASAPFFGLLLVGLLAGCGSGGDSSSGGTTGPTAQATAAPAIQSIPPSVAVVGKTLTYDVDAIDADSTTLIYSLPVAPAGMSIVPATGVITWTPQATQVGDTTVSITVSDGLNSRTQTFVLAVFGVTQELASVPISSATGGTVTVSAPTSSLNGLTLTFPPNALPADATITVRELTTSSALPGGQLGGLRGFSLEPDGLVLNSPVTVTIPFDPSALNSGGGIVLPDFLGVFFLDPHTGQKVFLDTFRVDTVQNVLVGTLDHFSEYLETPIARLCPPPIIGNDCPGTYNSISNPARPSRFLPALLIHGFNFVDGGFGDESTWGRLRTLLGIPPPVIIPFAIDPQDRIEAWRFDYNSRDVSFRITARDLFLAISRIKRETNRPAVNVVAHSFGGILARTYLQGMASVNGTRDLAGPLLPYQNNVNKLMTLGTPHRGIGSALFGDDFSRFEADFCAAESSKYYRPTCFEAATARRSQGKGALLLALNRERLPELFSREALVSRDQPQYRVIIGQRFENGRRSDGLKEDDGLIKTAGADICAALALVGGCVPSQILVEKFANSASDNFALCHTDSLGVDDCGQGDNKPMAEVNNTDHPSWKIIREFLTTGSSAGTTSPPAVSSTLTVSTPGNGTVTSNPAGIQCGSTCVANFENGTFVTLSPLPNSGFTFSGWSGACANTVGPCKLAINGTTSVQANFTLQVIPPPPSTSVNVTGIWQGTHTDNFVPTAQPIILNLTQTGTNVTGSWTSQLAGNGGDTASGTFTGNFTSGSIMTFVANQTSPVSCPGSFTGTATVNGNSMSATYSGNDCRGPISNGQVSVTKLAAPSSSTFTLAVSKQGTGTGTVTSSPAGIDCGGTCAASFTSGTPVTVTPTPATGSAFAGWQFEPSSFSGGLLCLLSAPVSPGDGRCTFTLDQNVTATAQFEPGVTLTVTIAGPGSGTAAGCTDICSFSVPTGRAVSLSAQTSGGSTFAGWSGGGCSGTGDCTLTMTTAQAVTATFNFVPPTVTITKVGVGSGTVTSSPAGINCGASCASSFTSGTPVTVRPTPATGSVFAGWQFEPSSFLGGILCSLSARVSPGDYRCTFTLDRNVTVTARFEPGG